MRSRVATLCVLLLAWGGNQRSVVSIHEDPDQLGGIERAERGNEMAAQRVADAGARLVCHWLQLARDCAVYTATEQQRRMHAALLEARADAATGWWLLHGWSITPRLRQWSAMSLNSLPARHGRAAFAP